ncbi:VOC family protein [Actinoplanes sp. GCM10030250]|uniref:VOC family protein n=1 Tax=Actinoplanes sp. GCM10030250 TaxID=3273376 RepID=UPI00361D9FD6
MGLQLRPLIHVADMAAAIHFFEQLGGALIHGDQDCGWVLMQLGTTQLALTRDEQSRPGVELCFGSVLPLDEMQERLNAAGLTVTELSTDRDFGEQLEVRTPDGLLIKINQREPSPVL